MQPRRRTVQACRRDSDGSNVTKALVIHDPVHGYIGLAPHERSVLDHRITQRLRHIKQTGLAEYVYPDARTSRFAHSLGAMHMASRFFVSAIENSDGKIAQKFLDELAGSCGYTREKAEALVAPEGRPILSSGKLRLSQRELQKTHYLKIVQTLECAIRFAALFHDLGHLPFSHDFELALREFLHSRSEKSEDSFVRLVESRAPHEIVGKELADLVFADLAGSKKGVEEGLLKLAHAILTAHCDYSVPSGLPMSAAGWLHSLVDGDLDADRADYLLRDGRALGLDFSHYDVERLAPFIVLAYEDTLGFVTAVDERGLSPLESFFLSRTRTHQVLVRHHKVAQVASALRFASAEALKTESAATFREHLTIIGGGNAKDSGREREIVEGFALYDDGWWFQVLRGLACPEGRPALREALELVLRRGSTIRSVWKRRGDLSDDQLREVNALAARARSDVTLAFERRRRELANDGTFAVVHSFKPYARILKGPEAGESLVQVRTSHKLRPASRLSPVFKSLSEMWENDVHAQVFSMQDIGVKDAIKELSKA